MVVVQGFQGFRMHAVFVDNMFLIDLACRTQGP